MLRSSNSNFIVLIFNNVLSFMSDSDIVVIIQKEQIFVYIYI